MRYVIARFNKHNRETAYRNYVTDCLYALVNGGLTVTQRFHEIFAPKKPEKVDNRTTEEIVDDIWAGITGVKNK